MISSRDTANDREYFAKLPIADLTPELVRRVDNYYEYLKTSSRITIWRRCYEYYFRGLFRSGKMNRAGSEGEYTTISVNHYRNLLQHLKSMTTQQLPALQPRAANTDYRSAAQTIVASGILDYYINEKDVAKYIDAAVESCLVFGEGTIECIWDPRLGEDYGADPEEGKVYKTGDVAFNVYTPMDLIIDPSYSNPIDHSWKIVKQYVNKFDLAEKYPLKRERIIDISIDQARLKDQRIGLLTLRDTDLIALYRFYHKKTESVPEGRMVEFVSSDDWLFDGALPYEDIPLFRIASEEQAGTSFGYTIGYDILPIQEAIDGLYSTVVTNQSNYGVQNIAMPVGAGISVQSLAGGLNLITYDPKSGKPEGLNLTNTPPEIFNFMQMLEHVGETLSGVNSVARGNPEASLKSGAALALVQSMAIQFNNGLQKAYARLWSLIGTDIIAKLKTFPQTKRNIVIAGKDNRPYMHEFEKDDLKNIDRVIVELGNPLTRTTAGKVDMADSLLQKGMITEPEQYIQVLTTGTLEPVYKGKQAELMLIKSENEKLLEAIPVNAVATDQHALHISEHKTVIASPESREMPKVVDVTLAHINDHINLLKTVDPSLLAILGQQAIQQPASPGIPANTPQSQNIPNVNTPETPLQEETANVNMPNMPTNPLSGKKYNSITGGL